VSAITSFCQKQSEASVSRIRTEDVLEDSSRNTRDVEGAKALIAVHDGTPFGLGEGRDAAQGREHVQEVPLPPHIVVEDVGDKEDERPSEAAVGEGRETMDIDSEREETSGSQRHASVPDFDEEAPVDSEGDAPNPNFEDEAPVDSEGDAPIPDFDDVSDVSPAREDRGGNVTPDKPEVSDQAENLPGRGSTSAGGATAEADMSGVASNRVLVPIVAEKECRAKENNDPPIVGTPLEASEPAVSEEGAALPSEPAVPEEGAATPSEPSVPAEGAATPSEPAVPAEGAATPSEPAVPAEGAATPSEPAVADDGDETPLGWTQVMADPTLGEGLRDLSGNRTPEDLRLLHGVRTQRRVKVAEGIDRVSRPFKLSQCPPMYAMLFASTRIRVIETTPLTPTDSVFSQGGLSEQWRERTLAQVLEGVMEKRESIVYHPGLVESLAKRVPDNPPPYKCMLPENRHICTSRMPDWNREPTLCFEAATHSPEVVERNLGLIVELLKHR
jgi:hypothetical protein